MKRWKVVAVFFGLLITLALAGRIYLTANASDITLSPPLQFLAKMYQTNHWDTQQLYKAQQEVDQRVQQLQAHPVPLTVGPDLSAPKPAMGILPAGDGGPVPFHSWDCAVNNLWLGDTGAIYAGWDPQNQQQGIVVALIGARGTMFYRTSALDGGLTITAVNGSIVTLQADDGASYTFDMSTGSLVRGTQEPQTSVASTVYGTVYGNP